MGWDQVDGQGNGRVNTKGDKIEFVPGASKKLRIIDAEPFSVWTHYIPNTKGTSKAKGLIINCPGKNVCPACASGEFRTRLTHALNVFDFESGGVKILESGNMIMKQIKAVKDMFGSLDKVNVVITRSGTGTNTSYMVMPMPDETPIPEGLQLFDFAEIYKKTSEDEASKIIFDMAGPVNMTPQPLDNVHSLGSQLNNIVPPQQPVQQPAYDPAQDPNRPGAPMTQPTPTPVAPVDGDVIGFGKYAAKTLDEVAAMDPSYLDYLAKNSHEPLKSKAQKLALAISTDTPAPAPAKKPIDKATEDFIAGLEADKTADNYKESVKDSGTPHVTEKIADNITIQTARIQKLITDKFAGRFTEVIDIMKKASASGTMPNGKSTLADFTVPELVRLEKSLQES